MIILKQEAIESINRQLALPFSGLEQDWDIEMANSARVREFVNFYQRGSISDFLSKEEKKALMALIVASYDDFLNDQNATDAGLWVQISTLIFQELDLFTQIIDYWSLKNDNTGQDHFRVTPLFRQLKGI